MIDNASQYAPHMHVYENIRGHDYVVGDIHGYYDELLGLLEYIDFDSEKDRLFSVGDIIDRGPESVKCIELLQHEWFYSVLGNHEYMMIQAILNNSTPSRQCWENNGGLWHKQLDKEVVEQLATTLNKLPYIISVGEAPHRFNVAHAELIGYDYYGRRQLVDDTWIDVWKFNQAQMQYLLWGREIIDQNYHYGTKFFSDAKYHCNNLSPTYVGHSITKDVTQIQKQIYIDTGIWAGDTLTIVSPTKQLVHQYSPNKFPKFTTKVLSLK